MITQDGVRVDMADLFQESDLTALIHANLRKILDSVCSLKGTMWERMGEVDGRLAMMDPMHDVAEPIGLLYELLFSACSDNADAISDYFRWHRG